MHLHVKLMKKLTGFVRKWEEFHKIKIDKTLKVIKSQCLHIFSNFVIHLIIEKVLLQQLKIRY